MKLRQLMFVLPNLFTVSSVFCGFYAVTLCSGAATPHDLYIAALAILAGFFFDGFDGRVARLTRTQSQFGMELDSLADVITFGVAPGLLAYRWALQGLGFGGLFVAFAFTACAALRLARFNVLAQRAPTGGAGKFFVGLPTPLAAGTVISMVIAHHGARNGAALEDGARGPVLGVILALALLMVSTVRYRTFKDLRLSRSSAAAFMLMLVGGVLIATKLHPAWVLMAYASVYLVLGLVETAVVVARRISENRAASVLEALEAEVAGGEEAEEDEDEPEVLEPREP